MSRVLVVDDEPGLRQSLGLLLADAGYDVAAEGNGAKALERAWAEPFDLVLCDVRMPDMDGLAFLRAYVSGGGSALVIMMSAYGGEEAALAAMKEGAYDYIPKPFRPDEVVLTLRKAEERERLGRTIATLRAQLDSSPASRALIPESRAMRQALELVARVAEHNTPQRITGERRPGGARRPGRVAGRLRGARPKDRGGGAAGAGCRVDLCDGLTVAALRPPPLAERREDTAPRPRHFAVQVGRRLGRPLAVSDEGLTWLVAERWPGNARELEHAVERAAGLSGKEILEAPDFRPPPPSPPPHP